MQRLILIQAILVLFAAIVSFYYLRSGEAILAALYGGAIALANTFLLSRRLDSASDLAVDNPNAGTLDLYLGVVQRFVLTIVMFAVGIGLLKLDPRAVLGAFAVAQLGYMICGSTQKHE